MTSNLPNYFLADLPPEATLAPAMVTEACQTLRRNRDHYLHARSTRSMVELLASVAENWLDPQYPLRQFALEAGQSATRFSEQTLASGLEHFFRQLTPESLNALVAQELGHSSRLDSLVATAPEECHRRAGIAVGPGLLAHIAAGTLPPPTLTSIVLGLLARSAQFVKCSSRAVFLPRLFAHSLYKADPKIGACLEIAVWPGGTGLLEEALFAEADCLTVTGSDETVAAIRQRLPARVRLLGYGHRVSFAYVTREVLSAFSAKRAAASASRDVAAWNQLGCLSPHVFYVENGGTVTPEAFAAMLAEQLAERECAEPRGQLSIEESADIATRRDYYAVRAANLPDTRLWMSEGSTAWTVVYEDEPRFQVSCLNRFIFVKSVENLAQALHGAEMVRGQVSTVGLAADEQQVEPIARELARWGVTRVCPLGQMQQPPLTWRHDGRPALGDLVTWMDLEK